MKPLLASPVLCQRLMFVVLLVYGLSAWAGVERFESNRYHFETAAVPDWVEPTPLLEQQAGLSGQGLRYLLSEWQVRVAEHDTETSEFTRIVYSPVTESGIQDAAEISISFRPDYEALTIHHVRLLRDGQSHDRLQASQVRLIQQERDMDKHMYNGEVSALMILDDVRVGDIIEYAYSIKGRNPVFAGKFFTAYSLGWKASVDRVAVRIVAPKKRRLYSRTYNIELEPEQSVQGDQRIYRWQLDNSVSVHSEGNTPDWYHPYPWLQVSEYKNWREVSRWADELYHQSQSLSPALRQQIKDWQAHSQDAGDTLRQAVEFVQDQVRYFGVEMGQNSHMPSRPDEVFERRYGDCKDKAVLLTAILNEMGYQANPALVSMQNDRSVADWLPSPGAFDHVIVRAVIDDQVRWIDATRTLQRGRLEQRGQPNFGQALVVGNGSRSLVAMEYPDDYLPTVAIEELFIVRDYDQPVEFVVTSRFSHGEAEWKRQYFANERLADVQEKYLNFYARIYPGIKTLEDIHVNDDEENNVLTIVERYSVPDYWERKEDRLYSNFYGSTIGDYTRLPKIINRKMPLSQTYPLQVRHSSILQYPEDIDFDDVDDEVVIADDDLRFTVRSSYKNRRLQVDYIYQSLSDAVMPDAMPDHLALRRKINDNLQFSAWISDPETKAQQAMYQPPQNIMKMVLDRLAAHRDAQR